MPCLCTSISLQPCVPNTFGLWFLVCVQASVFSPVFQTRLDCGSLSATCISLQPFVSNTFDYGFLFSSTFFPSVATLARSISCSNVHGVFPVHERFWFCLVQVSLTQFGCFPLVLMARASDGTDVPVSPLLPLRMWVVLTALFLTSKEQDTVQVRWRRASTKCSFKSKNLPLLMQS